MIDPISPDIEQQLAAIADAMDAAELDIPARAAAARSLAADFNSVADDLMIDARYADRGHDRLASEAWARQMRERARRLEALAQQLIEQAREASA